MSAEFVGILMLQAWGSADEERGEACVSRVLCRVLRPVRADALPVMPFSITLPAMTSGAKSMTTLAVTAKGQVTLKRDLLRHLGIQPGQKIEFEKMPGGELRLRPAQPKGNIDGFLGMLAGQADKVVSIAEMNEAASAGWAGRE